MSDSREKPPESHKSAPEENTLGSPKKLKHLLKEMIERGASDLHLTVGAPPCIRIDGSLTPLEYNPLRPSETQRLCYSVLNEEQKAEFEETWELDFSFGLRGLSRFRANVFMQRGAVSGTFRRIPFQIRPLEELGLPSITADLARLPRGLVLVTGPTGSGKSTTLAAILDIINQQRREHIVTIEDPIEYLHQHRNCIINQREVGADTRSFGAAIRRVLRQDPDVVLIGEMRDLESIEATLVLAETGHLVLATLHTNSTIQTINRIIDVFPPYQQQQIRVQLSFVVEAVLCQQLLPKIGGGRTLAVEMLFANPAVRNLIREDKLHQIYSQMQLGQSRHGMMTMNQSLFDLSLRKHISWEDALSRSSDPDELKQMYLQYQKKKTNPPPTQKPPMSRHTNRHDK